MSGSTLNTKHLIRELDALKPDMFPLHPHALSKADLYIKEMYARMLAAVLLVDGKVSETEHRLFGMLLRSLDLLQSQATFIEQAVALDSAQLRAFMRVIKETKAESCFVVDALVLCRVEGQLSNLQTQLLTEFLDFFQLPEHEVAALLFWVAKILNLPVEIDIPETALQKLSIKQFKDSNINLTEYSLGKIYVQRGEYVTAGQKVVRLILNRDQRILHFSLSSQEQVRPVIESNYAGLVYSVHLKIGDALKANQTIAMILPFNSATNAWLEFI
ncbi:hypothetical protein [Undibacterium sp. WLX3042]|uniref:hypothetical protein n=1 Tax=Undibacterium sp. WLX3042 TaxID=3412686 RepID=UPI003C2C0C1F